MFTSHIPLRDLPAHALAARGWHPRPAQLQPQGLCVKLPYPRRGMRHDTSAARASSSTMVCASPALGQHVPLRTAAIIGRDGLGVDPIHAHPNALPSVRARWTLPCVGSKRCAYKFGWRIIGVQSTSCTLALKFDRACCSTRSTRLYCVHGRSACRP